MLGLAQLLLDPAPDERLEARVLQPLDDLLEVALEQDPHRLGAGEPAGHHVEDLVLVELADGAAVRGGHVVGLDDQRRDRVALRLRREQHLVRLQVRVGLLRVRHDLDQALVGGPRLARERALPDGVAGRVAGLVQVGREQVEVLVALGEVHAAVAHVRAGLRGDDVEPLLGHVAAQVHGHPLDARVAADLHPLDGHVVDVARAPVLVVGEVDLGAGVGVQLERAGVERLALEVGRQAVLADAALGELADHRERVRVLRRARLVDQVHDLDRVLDLDVLGHMDERAAGPEGGRGGGELALVVREPLPEVLLDQLGVLLDGLLQRHHDDPRVGVVRVDDAGAALDDQPRVLLVAEVLADDLRQLFHRVVAARLELVQGELAQARGPEAGAPPVRQRLALEDLEGGLAPLLDEISGHWPRPPPARTRSPSPPARSPARSRPRGRSGRRA